MSRRIIPADAGNTVYGRIQIVQHWDHPRGCGEHQQEDEVQVRTPGSSPRMRGTLICRSEGLVPVRIIPADAGNTYSNLEFRFLCWDHPRGCGEHRPREDQVIRPGRIIPADAGNTLFRRWSAPPRRDHPRGCGEHDTSPEPNTGDTGSSPRMRGTPCIS